MKLKIHKYIIKALPMLLLILTTWVNTINAQNISNPDFEIYSACPIGFSQISRATNWSQPTAGTSDYFNCSIKHNLVPNAQSGTGYAGVYLESGTLGSYKEYITNKLSTPLIAGVTYTISFYAAQPNGIESSVDRARLGLLPTAERGYFGLCFSLTTPPYQSSFSLPNTFAPTGRTYLPANHPFYTSQNTWLPVTLQYTAAGGEEYMTVGQFRPGNTSLISGRGAYALVDNFSNVQPTAKLTKSVSPAAITDGGTATYTFTVTNTTTGNVALNGVNFTDALPNGLRVAATPNVIVTGLTGGTVSAAAGGTSITVSGYSIAANTTATITVNVTNLPGQLNPTCVSNPAAFTNSATNISNLSLNLTNNVNPVCLVVNGCGNIAPPVNTPVNNICPATTVNLNTQAHTGTVPTGSNLIWYTNNTHTGAAYTTPTAAVAGTYYAFYYNPVGGCYSPASVAVTVTNTSCTAITCTGGNANIAPNGTTTINGITVTSSSTGSVLALNSPVVSCAGAVSISGTSLLVGSIGSIPFGIDDAPWQTTLNFSQPVNNIILTISGSGITNNEKFYFNSNNGTISISSTNNCYTTISGNSIFSGQGATTTAGGGVFQITSTTPFTTLTMNGLGGSGGSAIAICSASIVSNCPTSVPILTDTLAYSSVLSTYTIPCGSLTANLSTLTASNMPPSGSIITWHTDPVATAANRVNPATAVAGTVKYYAAFYNASGNCYSPTKMIIVAAPICAVDDDYTATPIIAGVGGTLPSIFGNDTYNGTIISTLPANSVDFTYELWTPSNATVDGNGNLIIPATTPAGTYTYLYKICDKDPDVAQGMSCALAEVKFTVIDPCQGPNSDGDGIADSCDLDDDNDGILDTAECSNTLTDMVNAYAGSALLNIVPSDFGLALNQKNQNVTADLSSKFGYPANSGAVIITITNASVHPTTDTWWTKNGEQSSVWNVTGKMSAFVLMAQDLQYYANDSKTIHIYDAATVIPVNAAGFQNQTPVAGQWSTNETTAQKTLSNLNSSTSTSEFGQWRYANMNFGAKSFGFSTTVAFGNPTYEVRMYLECDADHDGIPNRLDLDSDNDGCLDAIEGSANITTAQLVTATGTVTVGTGSTATNQNLGNVTDANGVPTVVSGGQGAGDSANAMVNSCYCYKPGITTGITLATNHGISALGRAGAENGNWPMVRKGAWTALESKTKGFVVNRISTTAQVNAIANPIEGMMVYDEEADCLKIYTTTDSGSTFSWKCFSTPACAQ